VKKTVTFIILIAIILITGLSVISCNNDQGIPSLDPGPANINPKLPADFPLPFNNSINIDTAKKGKLSETRAYWEVYGTYPGSNDEIFAWYKEATSPEWTVWDKTPTKITYADGSSHHSFGITDNEYWAILQFDSSGKVELYVQEGSFDS
jgi:hypothetical protein